MLVHQTNRGQNYTQWWGPRFWPESAPQPGEVTDRRAVRPGTDSACHLPSEERLSRSKASVKEQTHQSWLHVMSLSKTNVKHYFVCLATAAPKFLKTANKLQLSCPWKLPGFMQKTKCHMLLGGVNPTPSVNLKFVTWTQKQVTSSEIKTIYTNFFRMTNYIHTT